MPELRVTERSGTCAVCFRELPESEMVYLEDKWICGECKPAYVQMMEEGLAGADMTIARHKRSLVMGRNASLPDRCVKCNAAAHGRRLKRNLQWHNPLVYVLLLANILIYALVAIVVRKKASIDIGICEKHFARRRMWIIVAWLLALSSVGAFVMGGTVAGMEWLPLVGVVLLLAALICGAVAAPVVSARKIDKDYVWLNGVCKDYLAALPEWQKPV